MATVVDFQARFPEFCGVDDKRVQLFLDDAALLMKDDGRWLDFYDIAHAYHAAHLLVVSQFQSTGDFGVVSPIKRQEVDDVVIEQAVGNVTPTADELLSTSYGKRYANYRMICFAGPIGA